MNRVVGLLCCLGLMPGLISAPAPTIEVTRYVAGKFESECRAPNESSGVPYWTVDGVLLNSTDVNERYGAVINLDYVGEGIYVSTIIISPVTLKLNNSTITCSANNTTVLLYHLNVVEADLVYLPTEEFSAICTNPSITSSHAPLFTYKDIHLNNVTINKLYGANVTRLPSEEGHRALLKIHVTDHNPTLNGSTVECLVDSAVIWRYYLILNESEDIPHTTTAALELSTTTDGVNQTVAVPELPESAASSERLKTIVMPIVLLLAVLGIVVVVIVVLACCYNRRTHEHRSDHDDSSTGGPPGDGDNQVPLSPRPLITAAEPQVAVETLGPPITTEPVAILPRTSRHERMPSLLRYSDENGVTGPADVSALDTTASTCLQLMTHSFSDEEFQGEVPQLSREEENGSEGQSLLLPCIDYKNVYQSYVKVWDKSSGQCHSVADGTSGESNA